MNDVTLWGLFLSAFLSSTLLPGGSEAVLAVLTSQQSHPLWQLLTVAATGNTLGGMSSWGIGRFIAIRYPAEDIDKHQHQQAVTRIRRWGSPVLLLSWLPVIGDPLCVAAGWLKVHWLVSLIMIGIGKTLRYLVVIYLFA
jgi:membrane protein YqaA with SNARE-associated domain